MTTPTSRDQARDSILRDGASIRIRPARAADEPALVAFLEGLALETRRLRFASLGTDVAARAHRWAVPERPDDVSLVAESGIAGRIIGNGSYDRVGTDSAEVAFVVTEEYQGRGVATLLLEGLAQQAHEAGITTFCAEVLPENARMVEVFRASGFPLRVSAEPGAILVEFPTALTGPARDSFERREQTAAAAAVRALLHPASVAVIGASRRRATIGGELFHNLVTGGFAGPVYPVNPNADVVQSVAAYRSVVAIPGPVDLAVLILPAGSVVPAARECATKGVRTIIVISPGFAEIGEEGAERQRELVAVCRAAGMRLVGPNCMGVINLEPDVQLNATFSPTVPTHGRVGFLSQSGALGLAIIEHANRLGLGLASFISIGNKADLSGNDFLQYWEDDPACAVIALYLESVGNPRKFSRIARRVGRVKPIIAVKSGRSAAGARATSSHTGARIGASDVTVDALFHQAGVVRTDTLGEFFDVASLLANQPLPAGRRVGILTNGGGPGILAADACEGDGLVVPPLPDEVRRTLAGFLPPEAALGNPVDTIDSLAGVVPSGDPGAGRVGWHRRDHRPVRAAAGRQHGRGCRRDPRCGAGAAATRPRPGRLHVRGGGAGGAPRSAGPRPHVQLSGGGGAVARPRRRLRGVARRPRRRHPPVRRHQGRRSDRRPRRRAGADHARGEDGRRHAGGLVAGRPRDRRRIALAAARRGGLPARLLRHHDRGLAAGRTRRRQPAAQRRRSARPWPSRPSPAGWSTRPRRGPWPSPSMAPRRSKMPLARWLGRSRRPAIRWSGTSSSGWSMAASRCWSASSTTGSSGR